MALLQHGIKTPINLFLCDLVICLSNLFTYCFEGGDPESGQVEAARDRTWCSRGPEGRIGRECDNKEVSDDLFWHRLQGESVNCSSADCPTIELTNRSPSCQFLSA